MSDEERCRSPSGKSLQVCTSSLSNKESGHLTRMNHHLTLALLTSSSVLKTPGTL